MTVVTKFLRIYKSETDMWHYEIEQDGIVKWGSLKTRDEREAQRKADEWRAMIDRAKMREGP